MNRELALLHLDLDVSEVVLPPERVLSVPEQSD